MSQIIRAILDVFVAGDEGIDRLLDRDEIVERVRGNLSGFSRIHRVFYIFSLYWVYYGIRPFIGKMLPLSFYRPEWRVEYLNKIATSFFNFDRMVYTALKFLFLTQIYSQPDILKQIGYEIRENGMREDRC